MIEKQKTLALVMDHFMNKAEEYRKSKDRQKIVDAINWDFAAIEVAGLGATSDVVGKAVAEYVNHIKTPFLQFDYLHSAIQMAKKGAPIEAVEDLIKFLVKHYCWIWALKDLTTLAGRKPTREEIFALVKIERSNQVSLSESLHQELIRFAGEHLSHHDVEEVKRILRDKITEWRSHPFD